MTDQLLTMREVCALTRLSRASVYRFIHAGDFPRQVKLGKRASRWRAADLGEWMEQLRAA